MISARNPCEAGCVEVQVLIWEGTIQADDEYLLLLILFLDSLSWIRVYYTGTVGAC